MKFDEGEPDNALEPTCEDADASAPALGSERSMKIRERTIRLWAVSLCACG